MTRTTYRCVLTEKRRWSRNRITACHVGIVPSRKTSWYYHNRIIFFFFVKDVYIPTFKLVFLCSRHRDAILMQSPLNETEIHYLLPQGNRSLWMSADLGLPSTFANIIISSEMKLKCTTCCLEGIRVSGCPQILDFPLLLP